MKFLLVGINAKYIHSNPAIYSLEAHARSVNEDLGRYVEVVEYTINQRLEDILADIYLRKPDVIGFSCYIWNWNLVQDAACELHKLIPCADIWLGGPEVSFHPEQILEQCHYVRGIMVGEGEATFAELLSQYVLSAAGEEYGNRTMPLPGTVTRAGRGAERDLLPFVEHPFFYRTGNEVSCPVKVCDEPVSGKKEAAAEINSSRLTPGENHSFEKLSGFENRILYYESGRGCPFRCSYCLSSITRTVRLKNTELVKKELQFFLDHRVPQVKFVDRTFNCDHKHALTIWRYLYEHDNTITNFHFEISADLLNAEELSLLRRMRPGLIQLEIGVQSTNEKTIREIRRTMDIQKLSDVVRQLREGNNIHVHLDLIVGLPYEDYDSFHNSFCDVYEMKPEQLQLGFLKVLKGSPMHDRADSYGICYLEKPPYEVLFTRWLSYEEVSKLKRIEGMVELYYNSSQFTHTLPVLAGCFADPFEMFEALADYYNDNGFDISAPSRVYRYQILLNFAIMQEEDRSELYRELLTFDMYLRENLKSRPAFSPDPSEEWEKIKAFYIKEEESPEVLSGYRGRTAKQMAKMTHLETFLWSVWETERDKVVRLEEPCLCLFDYSIRNPLNREARTALIDLS